VTVRAKRNKGSGSSANVNDDNDDNDDNDEKEAYSVERQGEDFLVQPIGKTESLCSKGTMLQQQLLVLCRFLLEKERKEEGKQNYEMADLKILISGKGGYESKDIMECLWGFGVRSVKIDGKVHFNPHLKNKKENKDDDNSNSAIVASVASEVVGAEVKGKGPDGCKDDRLDDNYDTLEFDDTSEFDDTEEDTAIDDESDSDDDASISPDSKYDHDEDDKDDGKTQESYIKYICKNILFYTGYCQQTGGSNQEPKNQEPKDDLKSKNPPSLDP